MAAALGWTLIGLGALAVGARLIRRRTRRARSESATLAARNTSWADVCLAALPAATGLAILGRATHSHLLTSVAVAAGVPLIGLTFFLLASSAGRHGIGARRAINRR
jgi:TRAP-type uncharacterized transport system fused permease subunit